MAQDWKVGDAILERAKQTGDFRGFKLYQAGQDAAALRREAGEFKLGSLVAAAGFVGVAMVSSVVLGSGLILPAIGVAVMQAALVGAAGFVGASGVAAVVEKSEKNKESLLEKVAYQLEKGTGIQKTIDSILGNKMAAKLGGWRDSKINKEPVVGVSTLPSGPK